RRVSSTPAEHRKLSPTCLPPGTAAESTVRNYSLEPVPRRAVNAIMRCSADERQAWGCSTLVVRMRPHAAKGRGDPAAQDHRIMRIVMSCLIRFALAAVLAMLASAAPAQPYPTRPIRLLVSFPPGGASDLVARTLGQ